MKGEREWPDLVQHAAGGFFLAWVELAVTGSIAMAIWWPMVLGYGREASQLRQSHPEFAALEASKFWRWGQKRLEEWWAWGIGAALAAGLYAGLRASGWVG